MVLVQEKVLLLPEFFAELKDRHYSIELILEYIKSWVYFNRIPKGFDQFYIFSKQIQYESRCLDNGVKNIITDSPIFLSSFYANKYCSKELAKNYIRYV